MASTNTTTGYVLIKKYTSAIVPFECLQGGAAGTSSGRGYYSSTTPINAIRLSLGGGGNFDAGTVALYAR